MVEKILFFRSKEKGFSLIELLVVVMVLAIVSTFGVISFGNYNNNQTLQQATLDLKSFLLTAKARSTSQLKPTACGVASLNGYRVSIDTVNRRYVLNAICGSTTVSAGNGSLPGGVTFGGGSATSIFFPVITGGAIINNGSLSNGTITLNLAGKSAIIRVMGNTGNIQ